VTAEQLTVSGSGIVAANGTARVLLGPQIARERWNLSQATVSVSSAVLESTCSLYLGTGAVPGSLLAASFTGSSGDTNDFPDTFVLQPGQNILAVWTGADVGAVATISLVGLKLRPGD